MKILLTILLFVLSLSSHAQKFKFTDNNHWHTEGFYTMLYVQGHWSYTDTLTWHGKQYKNLRAQFTIAFPGGMTLDTFNYWIREDTVSKTVHIVYDSTFEDLLYNFNATVGLVDTLYGGTLIQTITDIDSISINGHYHKVFTRDVFNTWLSTTATSKYIEGIGSNIDPIYPLPSVAAPDSGHLLCFTNNSVRYSINYPGTFVNQCVVGVESLTTDNSIDVFPNPAFDVLNINLSPAEFESYTISNMLGKILISGSVTTPKMELDVSWLPADIYIVRFTGKEEARSVRFSRL